MNFAIDLVDTLVKGWEHFRILAHGRVVQTDIPAAFDFLLTILPSTELAS
jgi:hypothetical protein